MENGTRESHETHYVAENRRMHKVVGVRDGDVDGAVKMVSFEETGRSGYASRQILLNPAFIAVIVEPYCPDDSYGFCVIMSGGQEYWHSEKHCVVGREHRIPDNDEKVKRLDDYYKSFMKAIRMRHR